MENIEVIKEKCTGCGICIDACPAGAIKLEKGRAVITDRCDLCGICVNTCEFGAIQLYSGKTKGDKFSEYKGVWVFAETDGNSIKKVSLELLGKGKSLARELDTNLAAVLTGKDLKKEAEKLTAYGADRVYLFEDKKMEKKKEQLYTDFIVPLVHKFKPEIFLLGATAFGRSLAPRIASRLDTGLTADCTGLEIDKGEKNLIQIRPAFGGNLMAQIITPEHRPQMATVRPGVMQALTPDVSRSGKIIRPELNISLKENIKIEKIIEDIEEKLDLGQAEIIVSGGRGMEGPKNLKLLEELAEILKGEVGASRAIVEEGWIDSSHQVGQSGSTVSPKIYFACGISGAIQHQAGMSNSDIIIAINKDPEAPIFDIANFGIVGDTLEVIPALIKIFDNKD